MTHPPTDAASSQAADLLAAYTELQATVLAANDVVEFLDELSRLAASLVPGSSCGITVDQYPAVATVVSSDHFALSLDEIQYGFHQGPCLEAMETNSEVDVPDLVDEGRWPRYRGPALAQGARSSRSIPLSTGTDGARALGALNLYSSEPSAFGGTEVANIRAFTRQAAIALTLMLRHAGQVTLEQQLREALSTRAIIDQALGILMGQQRITSAEAWELLRKASSVANRKMGEIATELIVSTTGHPPHPPRPFADPR